MGIGAATSGLGWTPEAFHQLFSLQLLAIAAILAPLLCGLASWIPAMLAAQQDPAVVLRGE
jgi:ABC-type lipoprotein release transport system permease subunit